MATTNKTCGNCRHWSREHPTGELFEKEQGHCERIDWCVDRREIAVPIALDERGMDTSAYLLTRSDFGCILWEVAS